MKTLLIAACLLAAAFARPSSEALDKKELLKRLLTQLRQEESGSGSGGNKEGGCMEMPTFEEAMQMKPVTRHDYLAMLDTATQIGTGFAKGFKGLADKADALGRDENDLHALGEHVKAVVAAIEHEDTQAALGGLHHQWCSNMIRMMVAGVEDGGQCHKTLEHLISLAMQEKERQGKRQMSAEELKFWQGVAGAAREEVGCIIGRFGKFLKMLKDATDYLKNAPPPAKDKSGDGSAFEAEVHMGALSFGYGNLYRQVHVFVAVMKGLMSHAEGDGASARTSNTLRDLASTAEVLEQRLRNMNKP